MKREIDKKFWGKIYRSRTGSYLKVDEQGNIGWSRKGAYTWESRDWDCGMHQHWGVHNFDKFRIIYEHRPCLENK